MKNVLIILFAIVVFEATLIPASAEDDKGNSDHIKVDASGNTTIKGELKKRKDNEKRYRYTLVDAAFRSFTISKPSSDIKLDDYVGEVVAITGKLREFEEKGTPDVRMEKITKIEKLEGAAIKEYLAAFDREFEPSPNAKPFMGTWGPRVCIPSAMSTEGVKKFDIKPLAEQVSKLTTASYVMLNLTQPAGGCYFTGPHPELAEALKLERASFPTRDVLVLALDAIQASGKKALVYFGAKALHANKATDETKAAWDKHIKSLGMTHHEATRKLIVKHYAERYGTKISGWWFDGSGDIDEPERILWRKTILDNNPKAIIVFNRMAGAPYRSTKQCDYFGGHTTPIVKEAFWSMANERMITDIEASPWMGIRGSRPVKEGYGALGHVFMGMQKKWTMGKCRFPPKQAIDWTTRVLAAGGMFTWAVPLNKTIPQIPSSQFNVLLKINKAVEQARAGIKPPPETEEKPQKKQKKKE